MSRLTISQGSWHKARLGNKPGIRADLLDRLEKALDNGGWTARIHVALERSLVLASVVSGMSPAARARRKRGLLIWGIIILLIWFFCSLGFASMLAPNAPNFASAFMAGQGIGGVFFLLGAILFIIGFIAEL